MTSNLVSQFSRINIQLEPRGIWEYPNGPYQKKQSISMAGRREGSSWDTFPDDNMAGFFLRPEHNIVIFDLDGCIIEQREEGCIYLPETDMLLPKTFNTITSNPMKQHHYYSITSEQQLALGNRQTKLPSDMDIFTYGSIFEGHPSEHQQVHHNDYVLTPLPLALLDRALSYQTLNQGMYATGVTVSSHPLRYNLTRAYLNDELTERRDLNKFYKTLLGQPTNPTSKKLSPSSYKFSYTLMNDLAVRLTSTAELDYDEHVVPTLNKVLQSFGFDPDSHRSKTILHSQILRTLPNHESITQGSLLDELDIDALMRTQTDTSRPFIVKIPYNSKVAYLDIDRHSLEPIKHGKSCIMQRDLAEALHPERITYTSTGSATWDSNIPFFYVVDDPYLPQYQLHPTTFQHTINLFIPTIYQKDARPNQHIPQDNIVHKLMSSTVHPEYLHLMLQWHAHLVWGHKQLNIVPWIATPKQVLGGTGKTQVTGTILTKLIGEAIIKIDEATFHKSWADIGEGVRSMSLQDFGALQNYKAFEPTYTKIKQVTDPMFSKQDSKHASISTGKQTYQLSGTSNLRPPIPESDRRIFALEPAHIEGVTQPLTPSEAKLIDDMVKDTTQTIYSEFQDYMDYLLYLYQQPLSEEDYQHLFMFTPETIYRPKWITTSLKKGERLYPAMINARELLNISKFADSDTREHYVYLLKFIVHVYCAKTQKVGVPYQWFKAMLPYIMADTHYDELYSVADISSILGQEFKTNVGTLYTDKWRKHIPHDFPQGWEKWASQGAVVPLTQANITTYLEVIQELQL